MSQREPEALRRGKRFHKLIQDEWATTAEGIVRNEHYVLKTSGRRGRVDIFVDDDDRDGVVAILEIKASDWNRMSDRAVRRNIRRQIRQVESYIDTQIKDGEFVPTGEGKGVCPGIIFPKRPEDSDRQKFIEEQFLEYGIVVVWHDEQ